MKLLVVSAVLAFTLLALPSVARTEGTDWAVKVGGHAVDPKSNNGTLAGGALKTAVGSDVRPIITAECLLSPDWGIEVLAYLPWEHDVELNDAKAATTEQLPPTVSLPYHFNAGGQVWPFVGLGLNYTIFFSEHTIGALAGTKLSLDNTLGAALHGGVDFPLDEHWMITADARWTQIDPQASVNGGKAGRVHIDPLVMASRSDVAPERPA